MEQRRRRRGAAAAALIGVAAVSASSRRAPAASAAEVPDAANLYAEQPFIRQRIAEGSCIAAGGCACAVGGRQARPHYWFKPGFRETRKGHSIWLIVLSSGRLCTGDQCDPGPDPFFSWPPAAMHHGTAQLSEVGISTGGRAPAAPSSSFGGVLGSSAETNHAFYGYNKVWLEDCSHDMWLGRSRAGHAGRNNLLALLKALQDDAQLPYPVEGYSGNMPPSGPATNLTEATRVFLVGEGFGSFGVLSLWELVNRTLMEIAAAPWENDSPLMLMVAGAISVLSTAQPDADELGPADCTNCPAGRPVEYVGADRVRRLGNIVGLAHPDGGAAPDVLWQRGPWTVRMRDGTRITAERGVGPSGPGLFPLRPLLGPQGRLRQLAGSRWNLTEADWPDFCRKAPWDCGSPEKALGHVKVPIFFATAMEPPLLAWESAGVDLTAAANFSLSSQLWAKRLAEDIYHGIHQAGELTRSAKFVCILGLKCSIDRVLTTAAYGSIVLNLGETVAQWADRWAVGIGARVIDWDDCKELNCNSRCQVTLELQPTDAPSHRDPDGLPAWGVLLALVTSAIVGCCCFWSVIIYPNRRRREERERDLERTRRCYEEARKDYEAEAELERERAEEADRFEPRARRIYGPRGDQQPLVPGGTALRCTVSPGLPRAHSAPTAAPPPPAEPMLGRTSSGVLPSRSPAQPPPLRPPALDSYRQGPSYLMSV